MHKHINQYFSSFLNFYFNHFKCISLHSSFLYIFNPPFYLCAKEGKNTHSNALHNAQHSWILQIANPDLSARYTVLWSSVPRPDPPLTGSDRSRQGKQPLTAGVQKSCTQQQHHWIPSVMVWKGRSLSTGNTFTNP